MTFLSVCYTNIRTDSTNCRQHTTDWTDCMDWTECFAVRWNSYVLMNWAAAVCMVAFDNLDDDASDATAKTQE